MALRVSTLEQVLLNLQARGVPSIQGSNFNQQQPQVGVTYNSLPYLVNKGREANKIAPGGNWYPGRFPRTPAHSPLDDIKGIPRDVPRYWWNLLRHPSNPF